jgi:hypothetical protein
MRLLTRSRRLFVSSLCSITLTRNDEIKLSSRRSMKPMEYYEMKRKDNSMMLIEKEDEVWVVYEDLADFDDDKEGDSR